MITSSIKTIVQTVLGADYKELNYSIEIPKNSFKGNEKRYSVLPKSFNENSGVIGFINIEQEYELILTDMFINKSMSDKDQRTKTENLQDKIILIYKEIVKQKAGSATCIQVKDLSVSDPEYLDTSIILLKATFKIKYRTQI